MKKNWLHANGRTDGATGTPSFRDAWMLLKRKWEGRESWLLVETKPGPWKLDMTFFTSIKLNKPNGLARGRTHKRRVQAAKDNCYFADSALTQPKA